MGRVMGGAKIWFPVKDGADNNSSLKVLHLLTLLLTCRTYR